MSLHGYGEIFDEPKVSGMSRNILYLTIDFMPCMHKNTREAIIYRRYNIPVYIYIIYPCTYI